MHATKLIANALNVTGPFNIQFIAKDREIKVIECNLRASRSFPFDSKVVGVDLIEMATRVMLGLPVTPYPPTHINGVAVKVPQFSFSRLSGADPVLGVEMASTGEVACFGKDKYEAYVKALISTAFKLPKKNILLSIGSFKEKQEITPAVRKLQAMGYKLFATPGTADYLTEQGIQVQYVEAFGDGDASQALLEPGSSDAASGDDRELNKKEHDLMKALSSRQIDLYINLPSMNNYRRPANYMSRGYRTRRMAVDYSIPLITNIKCAKLFIEALSRLDSLPVHPYDYRTSSELAVLPGFIEITSLKNESSWEKITSAALAGGFTFLAAEVPAAPDAPLLAARAAAAAHACSDYGFSLVAAADGSAPASVAQAVKERDVFALRLPSAAPAMGLPFSTLMSVVAGWSAPGPIVTTSRGGDLAALLFVAGVSDRRVHVSQVTRYGRASARAETPWGACRQRGGGRVSGRQGLTTAASCVLGLMTWVRLCRAAVLTARTTLR